MPRPRAQLDTAALAARVRRRRAARHADRARSRRRSALAKPTLYARGGDKEELFALAVEAEVERLLDASTAGSIDLARALDDHLREAPDGPGCCSPPRATGSRAWRRGCERSLRRIPAALTAALGDEVLAAAPARRGDGRARRRPAGRAARAPTARCPTTRARRPACGQPKRVPRRPSPAPWGIWAPQQRFTQPGGRQRKAPQERAPRDAELGASGVWLEPRRHARLDAPHSDHEPVLHRVSQACAVPRPSSCGAAVGVRSGRDDRLCRFGPIDAGGGAVKVFNEILGGD